MKHTKVGETCNKSANKRFSALFKEVVAVREKQEPGTNISFGQMYFLLSIRLPNEHGSPRSRIRGHIEREDPAGQAL
jgi:hypothetical protein